MKGPFGPFVVLVALVAHASTSDGATLPGKPSRTQHDVEYDLWEVKRCFALAGEEPFLHKTERFGIW